MEASTAPVGKVSQREHSLSPDEREHWALQTDQGSQMGKHASLKRDTLGNCPSQPGAVLAGGKEIAHFWGASNVTLHLSTEARGRLTEQLSRRQIGRVRL